jgi:arylformamidase
MDYEHEYNPRKTVANAPELIAGWTRRSEALHARLSPIADVAYGEHPREVLDLYRTAGARGTVVYVHGGYWRMLSKFETTWVAEAFLGQGLSVALINYPLCPEVTVDDIRSSVQRAFAKLWRDVLTPNEKRRVVVVGHSAGGHLAALHLATDWQRFGLPVRPLAGVLAVSGVFDVTPLIHTSMNADIRLTPESAGPLNLMTSPVRCEAPLLLAVGALEPEEFHRQSRDLAAAWPASKPEVHVIPGANHFTAIDGLAVAGDKLNSWVLERAA